MRPKRSTDSEAQIRLQKLEDMVATLMRTTKEDAEKAGSKASSHNNVVDSSFRGLSIHNSSRSTEMPLGGHLSVDDSETNYLGATHWEAILENIRDIQGALGASPDDSKSTSPSSPTADPDIVFGTVSTLTLKDVCEALPPRAVADRTLAVFFNGRESQFPILHSGKFLREYESFWAVPSSASFLWISILFSALHMGSQMNHKNGRELSECSMDLGKPSFFTRAGQALVTGRYDKAKPYAVEAVLLYAFCNFRRKEDRDMETWMLTGLATRLAMRMGYHRDPRHLVSISPFEGEMRRRTFMIVETFDLLLSFQAGLPPTIHEDEYDTDPPSNLLDTDFDEDCEVLPLSRPVTDPTPMLYFCYKSRLAKMLRSVIRHTLALKPTSYERTMELDRGLHEMHTDIPPSLRMKTLASQFMDPPHVIMNRLNIDQMYLRCLIVLHRKYLSHERSSPDYEYSRKTCIDAALQILRYQANLHAACQPGGQFSNDKWMFTSLQLHDFLLAAMVVCLDLYESHSKPTIPSPQVAEVRNLEFDALKVTYSIWSSRKATSRDARRASDVLAVMLSKVSPPGTEPSQTDPLPEKPAVSDGANAATSTDSSGGLSWVTGGYDFPIQEDAVGNDVSLDPDTVNPLDTVFGTSDNIDWGLVDQYLNNPDNSNDIPLNWEFLDDVDLPQAK